jgi:hypothetical protein
MRYLITTIAVTLIGCATQAAAADTPALRHAANIAAAQDAGYRVISDSGRMLFCPTVAPTGSHIAACLTETEWEHEQMWVSRGPSSTSPSGVLESGRSPWSGAAGH